MRTVQNICLVVPAIFASPALFSDHRCTDLDGACQDTTDSSVTCDGSYESGLCDGASTRMCCIPYADAKCESAGGECLDSSTQDCASGSFQTGYCDGGSSRKCCLEDDYMCTNADGQCLDTTTESCSDGHLVSGYCEGGSTRKCCVPGAAGQCPLYLWTSANIAGYSGKNVYIEDQFKPTMTKIENAAASTQVTVYVTQAFRIDGIPVDGAIVPPATHSNHLVGHAIDMNLDTAYGWCNSNCLQSCWTNPSVNPAAYNFLDEVQAMGVTWGGIWSEADPVHLDDRLNKYHDDEWEALYVTIQPECQDLTNI